MRSVYTQARSNRQYARVNIYIRDREVLEKARKKLREMGVSLSELVFRFLEAFVEERAQVELTSRTQIFNLNINIQQQHVINVQKQIFVALELRLQQCIDIAEEAIRSGDLITMNNALVRIRDELKAIIHTFKSK